ncbi:cytochrome P450 1B1 [Neosynchiropus ocellatus]
MDLPDLRLERVDPATVRAVLLAGVTLLFSLQLRRWFQQRTPNGPPGPIPWPVIGNAAQLGKSPHLALTRMASRYGSIFQIKLGSRTVVVLNGDAIRQALVKQGPEFAGRPDFTSFQYISNGNSLAFGTMTDWWKLHRRLAQSAVRMFSTGNLETKKTFEQHVVSEVTELLQLFDAKTKAHGSLEPMSYLVVSNANIMSAVCFGKRYPYDDVEFRQVVGRNDQFTQTVGAGSMVDVMPWLQYFPNPIKTMFENFKRLNREFGEFIRDKVVEHRKTVESSSIRDITDAFIVALDQALDRAGASQEKDYVTATMGDVFGASQDTLSTALQWIILILVKYPEEQERLQLEVDKVVGRSRLPSIEDQVQVPYVMAFIYEVLRFTSFVPLTIPHSTMSDTNILGYNIPKHTVVFVNQWSVNHDPNVWPLAKTFNPRRFLCEDGSLNKDLCGGVLIFSLGKRRCIGEELSKMQLFLFTALLAHQCHISSDPARPPTLDGIYGLTLKPLPYSISVTLREDAGPAAASEPAPDSNAASA